MKASQLTDFLEAPTTKGLGAKEPNMLIIRCEYHPGLQQIAFVDTETGEVSERRLAHREPAEVFYRELKQRGMAVRVGMESSGHSRWFERLLQELGFELWDRRSRRGSEQAGTQAKDRSSGCAAIVAAHDRRAFSADLDSRRGQSGHATVAVASAPPGADAHTSDARTRSAKFGSLGMNSIGNSQLLNSGPATNAQEDDVSMQVAM
jgi:hypothetical protein